MKFMHVFALLGVFILAACSSPRKEVIIVDAPPPMGEMERIDLTTRSVEDTPVVEPQAIQLSSYKTRSEKLMDFRKATLDATDGRVEIYPIDGNFVPEDFKTHQTPQINAPVRRDISSVGVDVYEVNQLDQTIAAPPEWHNLAPIVPSQMPIRREIVQPRPQNVPAVFFGHNATGLGEDDMDRQEIKLGSCEFRQHYAGPISCSALDSC